MNEVFAFNALPSPQILAALIALLIVLVVLFYWRTTRPLGRTRLILLGIMRWSVLAAILFCLFEPTLTRTLPRDRKGFFVVAVDTSASMSIPDESLGMTRMERAKQIMSESKAITGLTWAFKVRHFALDSHARRLTSPENCRPSGDQTALLNGTAEILDRYRGMPLGGVLLISDGADNATQDTDAAMARIRSAGVPIYTAAVGSSESAPDIAVTRFEMPQRAKGGTRVPARVSFSGNPGPKRDVVVEILQNDRVLAAETIRWPKDATAQTVELKFTAHGNGYQKFMARVQGEGTELIKENNQRIRFVKLEREDPPRALYVESRPRQEYKFIKRALEKDDWIRFASLLYVGSKRVRTGLSGEELRMGLPDSGEEMSEFRVIILGDFSATMWTRDQINALEDFVGKRGGGLILLGGPLSFNASMANTALGDLCPFTFQKRGNTYARTSRLRTAMTTQGLSHPVMRGLLEAEENSASGKQADWKELPAISGANIFPDTKPAASVLAQLQTGDEVKPLVAVHRYGAGKVMAVASDQLWHWQMLLPSDDKRHERFLRQAVRWMAEIEIADVTLTVDREQVGPEEPAQITVQAFDAKRNPLTEGGVELQVSGPNDFSETIRLMPDLKTPGSFRAIWTPGELGDYALKAVVRAGEREIGFGQAMVVVAPTQMEFTRTARNDALLQRIASATKGQLSRPGEPIDLSSAVESLPEPEKITIQRSAWDRPWLLAALAGLFCLEWIIRRALGLS